MGLQTWLFTVTEQPVRARACFSKLFKHAGERTEYCQCSITAHHGVVSMEMATGPRQRRGGSVWDGSGVRTTAARIPVFDEGRLCVAQAETTHDPCSFFGVYMLCVIWITMVKAWYRNEQLSVLQSCWGTRQQLIGQK